MVPPAAHSRNIVLYNRQQRSLEVEHVPGGALMDRLYRSSWGRWVCDMIMGRIWFSRFYGWPLHHGFSRRQIARFIRTHAIDMDDVVQPENGFNCFNDFFIRRLKPGARPIDPSARTLISPADSRLKVIHLEGDTVIDVKGAACTLSQLLAVSKLPDLFHGGLCLQFRLAPVDYHRFGYICDGRQGPVHHVNGRLYSVNPLALNHLPDIWWRNLRHWCFVVSPLLGTMIQIEVGATMVGSIVQHHMSGTDCRRGQEKGYFQMGGSTVLIVLQAGRVAIDDDIVQYSEQGIESIVKYGETIGRVLSAE